MKNIQISSAETDAKVLARAKASVPYVIFAFFIAIFFPAFSKYRHLLQFQNGEFSKVIVTSLILFYFAMVITSGYGAWKRAQLDWQNWKSSPHEKWAWKRWTIVWTVRAMYVSVILAASDFFSLSWRHPPIFSKAPYQTGNRDALYSGFGYTLVDYEGTYFDDARTLGPEVWFWFTPIVIDAAHGGIKVHWLWDSSWRQPVRHKRG